MTGDIRKRLQITPFVPFSVRTSDGRKYPVPTVDHIYLPPSGGRVVISDDEGVTWRWKRHLEYDNPGPEAGAYHYPSIIQARDGSLHASYSFHLNRKDVAQDAEGRPRKKAIR